MQADWLKKSALLIGAAMATAGVSATTTIGQKIGEPAYILPQPTDAYWPQIDNSAASYGFVIANVMNGPNNLVSSPWQGAIHDAHAAGIAVLGYVDSGYLGTTNLKTRLNGSGLEAWRSQIQHDIDAWYTFYGASGLDGIFFDQGANTCGTGNATANVYQSLTDYVKQNHPGAITVLNPGINVPQCYQNSADVLVTFENTYACYSGGSCPSGAFTALSWNPVDPRKILHLVYATTELQLADAISRSKSRNAGYVYITEDSVPNPWDSVPTGSYWSSEQTGILPGGTADTTAPTVPADFDTVDVGYTWVSLDWTKSTDTGGSGVVAYDLYDGTNKIWSVPATTSTMQTYTVTGLQPTTTYHYTVQARDGAGNVSAASTQLTFSTENADGSPPTAPLNPTASQVSYTNALLSWAASTDCDDTVAFYDVYKAGTKIMTTPASVRTATVIGLEPGSSTSFTVKARDSEGNTSPSSTAVNVTTLALPGGQAIANPTGDYTNTVLSFSADYLLPFAFRRVFIDADLAVDGTGTPTGFLTSSSPAIGADYLIENSKLYRYSGPCFGQPWCWTEIKDVVPTLNGVTQTWQIVPGDLTGVAPGTTLKVTYQGDGFADFTYSSVASLVKH
jgi:chitodextrinase